ncbi:MAG: PDZ domain-containing protein [bacterium]|nr:PDZ domain-containing protein [bacterium]
MREYRVSMFAPFEKHFSLFGEGTALPALDEAAAAPTNAIEQLTTIPETYEKPLGGYAEAQMKTGLIVLPIDQYVQRRYRLEADHGLLVYNLQKLGIAEKGGLQKRDIITSVANKRVDSREMFTYVLNNAYVAEMESIPVTVLRGGQELPLTLKFEKKK